KAVVLRSYTAVDIIAPVSPFGAKLEASIEFIGHKQDLDANPNLPLDEESIDVIIATEILEHVSEQSAVDLMYEMYDILRVGGVAYISTANANANSRSDAYHIYEWPLRKLLDILIEIGFDVSDVCGTYIDKKVFESTNKTHELV